MSKEEKSFQKTSINWYPGHMAKTKREIKEKLSLIDIVFELIDARIPLSSKNKDIDELIQNKPRILIMTKKDLCDINKTNKFVEYYKKNNFNVLLLDLNNDNINKIYESIDPIIDDINKKRQKKGLKPRRVRILILGIPNVGKSTLINKLVKKRATNVGNRPGVTKNLEWIRINDELELLDTPGILLPKFEDEKMALNLASMTAIKEEVLNLEDVSIYIINKMVAEYYENINKRYNLNNEIDLKKIINIIAKKIGAIKNNEIDYDRVYRVVLKDLKEGYLGKITFDDIK